MPQKGLYDILKESLELIVDGKFNEADRLLEGDGKKAFLAEAKGPFYDAAEELRGELHNAKLPAVHHHVQPFAEDALKLLNTHEEIGNPQVASLLQVAGKLHDGMHEIDGIRSEQAEALTKHETALYREKGTIGYNLDLIKRRFGAEDARAGAEVEIEGSHSRSANNKHAHGHEHGHGEVRKPVGLAASVKEGHVAAAVDESAPVPKRLGFAAQMRAQAGGDVDAGEAIAPEMEEMVQKLKETVKPKAKTVSLKGTSLEEFGRVKQVNTVGRKLAFGAGSAIGLGLFVHGGHNMFRALVPSEHENIEVESLGQGQKEGVNWMRLGVGVTEAAVGAVAMHRALTGRLGIGAVKGSSSNIMPCTH